MNKVAKSWIGLITTDKQMPFYRQDRPIKIDTCLKIFPDLLDLPIIMVGPFLIRPYVDWISTRRGIVNPLPTELLWEKSARSVDHHLYPWGDGYDSSYCCMAASHSTKPLPVPVDSFPIDKSVYGVLGLGGNTMKIEMSHPCKSSILVLCPGRLFQY